MVGGGLIFFILHKSMKTCVILAFDILAPTGIVDAAGTVLNGVEVIIMGAVTFSIIIYVVKWIRSSGGDNGTDAH
jgi:hypothetical protein